VLTFNGDRWASRTSRSLLLAARLPEWCTADRHAYVAEAIRLALSPMTPAKLVLLRSTMRQRLAATAVCDRAVLCRALERFYRKIAAVPRVPRRRIIRLNTSCSRGRDKSGPTPWYWAHERMLSAHRFPRLDQLETNCKTFCRDACTRPPQPQGIECLILPNSVQ
jgi:hypothetical protein